MSIETVGELHEHLRAALRIELAAVPPYLYAMYSIADQGSEAALMMRSIVVEEMLHAALVANIMLAVGDRPAFEEPSLLPEFPMKLPHHEPPLELGLRGFSEENIRDVFMRLEQPEEHRHPTRPGVYETLGQFYHAVETGLLTLGQETELFADPQREWQLSDPGYYRAVAMDADDSGGLLLVHDVDSAMEAIEIIIHQGEGLADHRWADESHQELTHYHKLDRIVRHHIADLDVHPVPENPRSDDYPGSVAVVASLFNASYRWLYLTLGEVFSPRDDKGHLVGRIYSLMSLVLGPLARYLVTLPLDGGQVAAPTFEVHGFGGDLNLEMEDLASRAVEEHPDLRPVAEAIVAIQT